MQDKQKELLEKLQLGEKQMEAPKKLEEEKDVKINFDFTRKELEFILENARFNQIQRKVFNRLTDIDGRQSIIKISIEEHISTATVSRIIKQIKKKILRLL